MKTVTDKSAEIESKIEAAKQRLAQLKALQKKTEAMRKAAEQQAAKKADTRRKILLGAFLSERMLRDAKFEADTLTQLDSYLTRDDDRALFGLPALRHEQHPSSSEVAAVAQ